MAAEEMEKLIAGLGGQLRWAADLDAPDPLPVPDGLVVAGMGGSGISGDLVAALAAVPVTVHKTYGLPAWAANRPPAVVAISYSGNTEETLCAVEAATGLGITPGVVTSGGKLGEMADANGWPMVKVPPGLQPRAALGYMLGSLLRLVEDAVDLKPGDLAAAADLVDQITGGLGHDLAADLAAGLRERIAIIYGIGVNRSGGAALEDPDQRKRQMAGLVDRHARARSQRDRLLDLVVGPDEPPCRDHQPPGRLRSPRIERPLHAHLPAHRGHVAWVGEVWSQGVSRLERIMSLCAMGDLVSLELATGRRIDPMPVPNIESLKQLLAKEPALNYDIADPSLAEGGARRIEWAGRRMPVLNTIRGAIRKGTATGGKDGGRLPACHCGDRQPDAASSGPVGRPSRSARPIRFRPKTMWRRRWWPTTSRFSRSGARMTTATTRISRPCSTWSRISPWTTAPISPPSSYQANRAQSDRLDRRDHDRRHPPPGDGGRRHPADCQSWPSTTPTPSICSTIATAPANRPWTGSSGPRTC